MRIAVTCHPTQGGSGIVATELALALADNGHDVHIVSCDRPYRLAKTSKVNYHKVVVPHYPLFKYPPHDLSLVNTLIEVIRDYDIDIVHAHYAVPHAISAIIAGLISKPHPVKIVVTMHGTDITLVGSQPEFYSLTRYAMQQSDAVTVVSEWLLERTMSIFNLDQAPTVIPNFVDPRRFTLEGRAPYPEGGEFVLLHASNYRPVKRVADIVRVFAAVSQRVPARLILAGEGPDLGIARELCAELNICPNITFAGSVHAVEKLFKQAHLFLLLSDYESFGLSALEAMACGTPAVVSLAGGLPEVVQDNETGLLCKTGEVEATADRIVNLLTKRLAWERMSVQTAKQARARFGLTKILPAYERMYAQVLARTGR